MLKVNFGMKHLHTAFKYRYYKNFKEDFFANIYLKLLWEKNMSKYNISQTGWPMRIFIVYFKEIITRHFKSVVSDMVNYKIARNRCDSLVRNTKWPYFKTCIGNRKGDSRNLWGYLKDLAPSNIKSTSSNFENLLY